MSKDRVCTLLQEHAGSFLSGEEISRSLGISRAAVWKAVDALRKAGYAIEAKTGLGYSLTASPDALSQREVAQELARLGISLPNLLCLDEVDSTNSLLKHLALDGAADRTVAIANSQSGGRGRMGRSFQSPRDKGIYLSMLLRPTLPPDQLMNVTALAAVAMCDAVERTCGMRPQIKWTNDLVLNGRKLCGILTEMALEGETGMVQSLVIGVGINVHHTAADFSPDVAQMASSLSVETGHFVSRPRLAAEMIAALLHLADSLGGKMEPWLAAYRRSCLTLHREVQLLWSEDKEIVYAEDIDEQFGLVVRHKDGRLTTVRSGEVSVRGLYGYVE